MSIIATDPEWLFPKDRSKWNRTCIVRKLAKNDNFKVMCINSRTMPGHCSTMPPVTHLGITRKRGLRDVVKYLTGKKSVQYWSIRSHYWIHWITLNVRKARFISRIRLLKGFVSIKYLHWIKMVSPNSTLSLWSNVGSVFPMVIISVQLHAKFGPNDHQKDVRYIMCPTVLNYNSKL